MRRAEKKISDRAELDSIIRQASVCRLALCDEGTPYIVPVCFGYQDNNLYFHSAGEGRKLKILERNNLVCFEMDIDTRLVVNSKPCDWSMRFLSVIGTGRAHQVEDPAEKIEALNRIMSHYSGPPGDYDQDLIDKTTVIRIEIESMTGKKSGY